MAVLDINEAVTQVTDDHIKAAGGEAIAIRTEISNEPSVEAAFAQIVRQFGRPDILVSNAGIFSGARDNKVDSFSKSRALTLGLRHWPGLSLALGLVRSTG